MSKGYLHLYLYTWWKYELSNVTKTAEGVSDSQELAVDG